MAAAHERGVLHRDLKPANVMLDGNGDVRITDFGIATAAADTGTEIAGTPQYMAPELLAGRPASTRSDIYALGLVLFEIFTGRRVYDAKTIGDLKELHNTGTVTTPSSIVRDLDPAIERVILRCLEKDPDRRPASALAVAAALPGGDPLAAALAAGETPSPDMLAAAGETGALDVRWGVAALAAVVVGLLVFAGLSGRTSIIGRVPLDREPAVLADRADQILASLGYPERPADRVYGLTTEDDYIEWLRNTRLDPKRWDALSDGVPAAVLFWYRTSPRPMVPLAQYRWTPRIRRWRSRTCGWSCWTRAGRLQEFRSVPPQVEATGNPHNPRNGPSLFEAAGLQMTAFSPVPSQWTPSDYADTRMAWEGPLPDRPELRVRVEAAAYRGKPVFFSIVGPWTRETRADPEPMSDTDRVVKASPGGRLLLLLLVAAMLLARRNFRTGRADRRGASRVALYMIVSGFALWLAATHHVASAAGEFETLVLYGTRSSRCRCPDGRRLPGARAVRPQVLARQPARLVAADAGSHPRPARRARCLDGSGVRRRAQASSRWERRASSRSSAIPPSIPTYGEAIDVLSGPGRLVGDLDRSELGALEGALVTVLVFVVLRLLLRRTWLSVAAGVVLDVAGLRESDGWRRHVARLAVPTGQRRRS